MCERVGCAHVQAGNATEVSEDLPMRGGQLMIRRLICPSTTACRCSQIASIAQESFQGAGVDVSPRRFVEFVQRLLEVGAIEIDQSDTRIGKSEGITDAYSSATSSECRASPSSPSAARSAARVKIARSAWRSS